MTKEGFKQEIFMKYKPVVLAQWKDIKLKAEIDFYDNSIYYGVVSGDSSSIYTPDMDECIDIFFKKIEKCGCNIEQINIIYENEEEIMELRSLDDLLKAVTESEETKEEKTLEQINCLLPKSKWKQQRVEDILNAMYVNSEVGNNIPFAWVEELCELLDV